MNIHEFACLLLLIRDVLRIVHLVLRNRISHEWVIVAKKIDQFVCLFLSRLVHLLQSLYLRRVVCVNLLFLLIEIDNLL